MDTKSARVILKISQAAKLLNVSKDTLRRWEKAGKIKAARSNSGYRLYDITDLVTQIPSKKLRNQIVKSYPSLQPEEEKVSVETQRLLKISEAATLLHVSKDTLRRWEQAGKIESIRTQAGYRLYDVSKLLDMKQKKSSRTTTQIYQNTSVSHQSRSSNQIPEAYQPKASDFIPVNPVIFEPTTSETLTETPPSTPSISFSSLIEQANDYLSLQAKLDDFHQIEDQVTFSPSSPEPQTSSSIEESITFIQESEVSPLNTNYQYSASIPKDDVVKESWIRASELVPPPLEISISRQNTLLSRGNPALSFLRQVSAHKNFNSTFGVIAAIIILILVLNISFYINPFKNTSSNSQQHSFLSLVFKVDKNIEEKQFEGSQVLAESTIAEIGRFLEVNADVGITGNLAVDGQAIFGEDITAPNILYGLVAGANVTITGDVQNPTISVSPTGIVESDTLASVTARGATTSTPVSFLGGATLGSMLTIGQLSDDPSTASNGGIYYNNVSNKYRCYINGSWTDCDTDTDTISSGDITGVSTGDGLTGGVSSGEADLSILLVTSGTSTTTSSNSGLEVSSSGLGLLRGCSGGELLKWNSSSEVWECSTDAAGTGDSTVQEGGVTLSSSIDTYNFDETDFDVSVVGSVASMSIDYVNSHITRDDQTQSISGAWTFSDLTVLDTNVAFTGTSSTLTATGALTFTSGETFNVNTNNFSQIYTSGVVTGTTSSSGFVLSAPSLTTGTALYLTSSATSGKLLDLNATQTSGSIFSLAYGASRALTGDLTGFYLNLESGGNLDITNQNFTGANVVVPAVTDTHTSGTKNIRGLLVNFGAGAGINQNGVGGTLEYIGGDFQLPALTQTAGTLNAYGVRLTTPTSITSGGNAYAFYVNPTGVAAGTLTAFGVGSITGGPGTEDAISIGTGWDSILKVGSNTIINGSGVTQAVGGGTGISTYATGDLIYASSASTLATRAIGNNNEVLTVVGGVPTWSTISGSSCTNCLINNPTTSQLISPTNDSTGLSVRQTSFGSPTADIFNITDSTGSTKYFYVDAAGNVSTGSISNTTLTLTPTSNQTALTLVGTNVTTAKNQYINTSNDSGTIFDISYGSSNTLTGSIIAHNLDLATNVTATNQSVSGYVVSLPGATNTSTSGTTYYKGIDISGGSLNQNGLGGTTQFIGTDITMPAITQTAGTMTAMGTRITTPSSITTGGTATGLYIAASGVGTGNLYGVNIGSITGGAGSETALTIGSGWDTNLYINDNTANIQIPDSGTLTFVDGSGNTLCSLTDAGTSGDFSCTGINGYWTRTGTTISPSNINDTVAITTANTTGADLALTNTGVYTGTGIVNIAANSATTGEVFRLTASALTSGSAMVIDGRTDSGQIDDFIKISSDIGAGSGSPSLLKLQPDFSPTNASSVHGVLLNATDSTSLANNTYGYAVNLTLTNNAAKNGYGVYSSVTSNSTTVDNINGNYSAVTQSGAMSSGFRRTNAYFALGSMTGASSGGSSELISYMSSPTVTGGVSSANVAAVEFYASGGTVTATSGSNVVTRYGYYAGNASMNTTGTTTQYGTYINSLSGADSNYGIFIGNASGTTAAASLAIGAENTSGTYSIFSNTSNASYFAGNVGVGSGATSPIAPLDVTHSWSTTGNHFGEWINVFQTSANASNSLFGQQSNATFSSSSGAIASVVGSQNTAATNNAGTASNVYGSTNIASKSGTGAVTNLYGAYVRVNNGDATGNVSNGYGLYIDDSAETGNILNDYGIYQVDAGAFNYFGGRVGINAASNTTYLLTIGSGSYNNSLGISSTDTTGPGLTLSNTGGGGHTYHLLSGGTAAGVGAGGFGIYDSTGGAYRLSIRSDGRVGFGVDQGEIKVDVNGGIQLRTSTDYSTGATNGSRIVSTPNLHLDSTEGATAIYLNYFGGTGGIVFCSGNSTCAASISSAGAFNTTSTIAGSQLNATGAVIAGGAISATAQITSSSYIQSQGVMYPGRIDVTGVQGAWYLASHASYGLYSNTGMFFSGTVFPNADVTGSVSTNMRVSNGNFYDTNSDAGDTPTGVCFASDGGLKRCSSDGRLKENISYITSGGLEKILALKPATFDFIGSGAKNQAGFIAQDLTSVIPESVQQDPEDGYYSFSPNAILGYMTIAIKELNYKVENALLTIGDDGYASDQVTVQKLKVTDDAEIAGIVTASDYALDVTKFNRTGTLAALPEDASGYASVADAINTLNDGITNLVAENASQSAQIAQAKVLGEQAVEHALTLDEKVASTSSTLSSLQTKIDELLAGFGDSSDCHSELDSGSSECIDSGSEAGMTGPELTDPSTLIASDSAEVNNLLVRSEATISGTLQAYNGIFQNSLKSLGETLLGNTTIAGDLSIDGTFNITGSSINSSACHPELVEGSADSSPSVQNDTCGVLFIQNNPIAQLVDFFNGAVIIASNGNITTKGEVKAATITADKIQITDNGSDSSVGSGVIPAGETEIPIFTNMVTEDSKIFVALTSATRQTVIVAEKIEGAGFVVTIADPESEDISFDWFIVN